MSWADDTAAALLNPEEITSYPLPNPEETSEADDTINQAHLVRTRERGNDCIGWQQYH
jgi:hypothetical protein